MGYLRWTDSTFDLTTPVCTPQIDRLGALHIGANLGLRLHPWGRVNRAKSIDSGGQETAFRAFVHVSVILLTPKPT